VMPADQIVTCRLGAESAFWRPDPFPGSSFARKQGCVCPEKQPWPGALEFNTGCPLFQTSARESARWRRRCRLTPLPHWTT
jgi:hypothetical protein